jgi:hypothetical protein
MKVISKTFGLDRQPLTATSAWIVYYLRVNKTKTIEKK